MKHTKQNILNSITWKENWLGIFEAYAPLFERVVRIEVLTQTDRTVSDRTLTILNDFTQLGPSAVDPIKRFLWESGNQCFECVDYGVRAEPGQTHTDANRSAFGVFSPDDAFQKSRFTHLLIEEENQQYPNNYGHLYFDNEWEGHFFVVVMKNGRLVGYGEDGLHIGQFE